MSAELEVRVGKEYFRQEGPCVQKTERLQRTEGWKMDLEYGRLARKGHG